MRTNVRLTLGLLSLAASLTCTAQPMNWVQKHPSNNPSTREGQGMAYDEAHKQSVLFGGNHGWAPLPLVDGETWIWDGSDWAQRFPQSSPSARYRHAMAYDEARDQVVLFGGITADNNTSDETWIWDGIGWTQRFPLHRPPARVEHGMAYDVARQQVVLFGGWDRVGGGPTNDTWVWDGTDWNQKQVSTSPPSRGAFGMAYDEARAVVVVFGGLPASYRTLGDTWEWDGVNWTEKTPAASPSRRGRIRLAYDAARQQTVLMGGCDDSGNAWADTWTWDGTAWAQVYPANLPPVRTVYSLAYDRDLRQVVLFGGTDYQNNHFQDTWVWVPVDNTPPVTTAATDPAPNMYGWNTTDVAIEMTADDGPDGSGVRQLQWELSGGQSSSLQTVPGSMSQTVVSASGLSTLTYAATDYAGNVEAWKSLPVRIDRTPPLIVPALAGTVGANGWFTSGVTVSWSTTDAESGVSSTSGCGPTVLAASTPSTTLTCAASNWAGLANSVSTTVKIDLIPPTISGMPTADCTLWPPNHKMVTVATVSASDQPSGLLLGALRVVGTSSEPSNPADPDVVITPNGSEGFVVRLRADRLGSGDGRVYTLVASATDLAGNVTTKTAACAVPHDQGRK